ncbi:MAG: polyprenyl synthetase family protein [bacterium]|jgi:geranylgeranyl diphosphate synthase type II
MNLPDYLRERAARIDAALDEFLPPADAYPAELNQAMRYSVFAGGKRLRPILTLAAAEAVGGSSEDALPAACAVEIIHTYSLIHDDLPAMDNDDYRRGKPTNHRVFGEATAILAGDALLAFAFELLARPGGAADKNLAVLREIAVAAGPAGLVGGQVMDIASEGCKADDATLFYIHTHKTGALFRAAVRAGAVLGGATDREIDCLTRYAEQLGLCFQITDDILDATGEAAKLGKRVRKDAEKKKNTFPALYGLPAALDKARAAAAAALAALPGREGGYAALAMLAEFIAERDK